MSPGSNKKSLIQKEHGFTLIELIIVIVIIGILALIALPKYYANVDRAEKSKVYASLASIREVVLAYYAVNGVYPAEYAWPITVTVDGDLVYKVSDPSNSGWSYSQRPRCGIGIPCVFAYKLPGNTCYYALGTENGVAYQTCTP